MRNILVILLSILLTSCATVSYKRVAFDVLRPASYTLPSWVDTLIISEAIASYNYSDSTIDEKYSQSLLQTKAGQKALPGYICSTLATDINKSGYLVARQSKLSWGKKITTEYIDSMLAGSQHTLILGLTSLMCGSSLEIKGKTCATMVCKTWAQMEMISSPSDRSKLTPRKDTLLFTSCGEDTKEIVSGFPRIQAKYEEMGENAGHRLADMFVPSWERVNRVVYVTNNTSFTSASQWIDNNNWQEARALWQEVYSDDKHTAARVRAALNVALSYEREDDPLQASMWCSKALDLLDAASDSERRKLSQEQSLARSMFGYLMERLEQKDMLDKQM